MKYIYIFLFILSLTPIYSQNKKIIFADEDLNILSKEEYLKNPLQKNHFEYEVENDSSIIRIKVERQKFGRIDKATNQKIRIYLQNLSNSPIDSSKTIIINYFPSVDKCQGKDNWNSFFIQKCNNYIKELEKINNISQFFIFKDENAVKNFGRKFKWYKDENKLIEKNFFKFHYPCFSYIIIKPNGNYYSERGEYNISSIPEKVK